MNFLSPSYGPRRLPLIPLTEAVHFPCTELSLLVVEPESRSLVQNVQVSCPEDPWIGTVLLKDDEPSVNGEVSVYGAGTAARLIDAQDSNEGCHIVLEGRHRFEIERVITHGRWREGWVQPMDEAVVSEADPDVQRLRRDLLSSVLGLYHELGPRFALGRDQLEQASGDLRFEAMVNHLSANLDLTAPKKLQLLRLPLPDRAAHLLGILEGRKEILDLLRPYRHLARHSALH